jgi:hypothetical protein
MGVALQGPMAGALLAVIGLYLLFGPIEKLAQKPSSIRREYRSRLKAKDVPTWMKVFFRGLGIVLLALAGLLLAPLIRV